VNFKITIILLLIILNLGIQDTLKAQTKLPKEVKKAFSYGNSENLSEYFDLNVEILFTDKGDVYSKAQAALIMEKFFENNKPKAFIVESETKDKSSSYAIALLKTKKKDFRILIAYHKQNKKTVIINQLIFNEL